MSGPLRAYVRNISPSLGECELSHVSRQRIEIDLARRQHIAYVRELEEAGVAVEFLPDAPEFPDATFVEDPVVILDEVAILCRSGNGNRLREAEGIIPHIQKVRRVVRIESPGTLEGGDVLRIGKSLYVGISSRTNLEGIDQLRNIVKPFGFSVQNVAITGCLHLKTAATAISESQLIANPRWIDPRVFRGLEVLSIAENEPSGANCLAVNGRVLIAASAPKTAKMLNNRGFRTQSLDISELEKAEAGLTCLSVIFRANP